jgi:hypothetical protein
MKIREHRGIRAESIATERECDPTMEALACAVQATTAFTGRGINVEDVRVTPYGVDIFTGKLMFIVTVVGYGVWGFCDMLPGRKKI